MPKLLSDAEVAQFKRDGYIFPVTAFGADQARDCAERVARYERETGKSAMKTLSFKAHVAFAMFSGLIRHPRILDAVEDVLGPDVVCWGSSFFLKPARSPKYISWHADTYYYGLEPPDTVTVWVAFTPPNRASGCIRVIPGSHLEDTPFDQTPSEHNMLGRGQTTRDVDKSAAVYMPLEPVQFSMHHERLVHSSEPNGADYRRIGYSIHYCPTHVRQTKFSGDDRPSAALVRGVDETVHWEHETMTTADFDPATRTWAEEQRRRVLSRVS